MRKTISLLVENNPGVLNSLSGLIARRGYNIESIAASSTERPNITRISLVFDLKEESQIEQIINQLDKLVYVLKITDMSNSNALYRELGLIKIRANDDLRQEIIGVADVFNARVLDMNNECILLEITDESYRVDTFCTMLEKYGILEIIRTGEVFFSRRAE